MTSTLRAAAAGLCAALALVGYERAESQPTVPDRSQAVSIFDRLAIPTAPAFVPSPANLLRVNHMVVAVSYFTLLHELGHMIVSEYRVPVIGQQENGVDRFATLMMTPEPKPPGSAPDTFDPATDPDSPPVMWAAWWWHELWTRKQAAGEIADYANRHGLDIARAVEVMCLVYGSDPERFEQPFRAFIPEKSRPGCIEDAYENGASWAQVLTPPLGGNWWKYEGRVSYNPAPPALTGARAVLMEAQVLEAFAEATINQIWVPRHAVPEGDYPVLGRSEPYRLPIDVVADTCTQPDGTPRVNAFWDPALRRIVLCYAFVEQFENHSRETIARTEIGQREKMPE